MYLQILFLPFMRANLINQLGKHQLEEEKQKCDGEGKIESLRRSEIINCEEEGTGEST